MHYRFEPGFKQIGEIKPKFLFAGDFPVITRNIIVKQGQKLPYGTVVGRILDENKYVLCCKTTTPDPTDDVPNPDPVDIENGSEEPQGILTEDVDATDGDKTAIIYLTGQFNTNYISLGEGYTDGGEAKMEMLDKLRKLNIFTEIGVKAYPRT